MVRCVGLYLCFDRRDSWDASLMFVLGCGVMVSLAGFPLATRTLGAPLCRLPPKTRDEAPSTEPLAKKNKEEKLSTEPLAEQFEIPTNTEVLNVCAAVLL